MIEWSYLANRSIGSMNKWMVKAHRQWETKSERVKGLLARRLLVARMQLDEQAKGALPGGGTAALGRSARARGGRALRACRSLGVQTGQWFTPRLRSFHPTVDSPQLHAQCHVWACSCSNYRRGRKLTLIFSHAHTKSSLTFLHLQQIFTSHFYIMSLFEKLDAQELNYLKVFP